VHHEKSSIETLEVNGYRKLCKWHIANAKSCADDMAIVCETVQWKIYTL